MGGEQLISGDLVAANIVVWLVPGEGWSLRLMRTYEYSVGGAPEPELYNRLSRGELLDVWDAIREELDLPLSEFS